MLNRHQVLRWLQVSAIPLLLLIVGFRQIVLVHRAGLSPWHGGGFGMFASVDRDERRLIKVIGIDTEGKEIEVDLTHPDTIFSERELTVIRTIPRQRVLQDVAYRVLQATAQLAKGTTAAGAEIYYLPQSQSELASDPILDLQTVQVQVFRLLHNRQTQEIWYVPVSEQVEVNQ